MTFYSIRGRDFFLFFFLVKDRLLRTGPDLEFSPFLPAPGKNAESPVKKILARTRAGLFFLYSGWGRHFFLFLVKDRPGEYHLM
jgi:hypothetical protein